MQMCVVATQRNAHNRLQNAMEAFVALGEINNSITMANECLIGAILQRPHANCSETGTRAQ
jgi:hypothetical protein